MNKHRMAIEPMATGWRMDWNAKKSPTFRRPSPRYGVSEVVVMAVYLEQARRAKLKWGKMRVKCGDE